MKTIQKIAEQCKEAFENDYTYDWRFVEKQNCSERLLTLIVECTSDTYLFEFLQSSLNSISKICEYSVLDEMRLSRDWSEPDFPEWDSSDLWKWLISDREHLAQVQEHVSIAHKLSIEANLDTCVQCAVWDEWRGVFEAVKVYLVEEYNTQPKDCDDEE